MKRLLSILFLVAITFSTIGINILFPLQQHFIKKEIKRKIKHSLPEKELTLITVNSANENQLDWEDEKEFHYKGNMYDIVRKKENPDGSITYYCINDTQEKELFINLNNLVKDKSGKENTLMKNMLGVQWIPTSPEKQNVIVFNSLLQQNNFNYSSTYQFSLEKSIIQPPEFI